MNFLPSHRETAPQQINAFRGIKIVRNQWSMHKYHDEWFKVALSVIASPKCIVLLHVCTCLCICACVMCVCLLTVIATSGIDYNVKLWEPVADQEASLSDLDEVYTYEITAHA